MRTNQDDIDARKVVQPGGRSVKRANSDLRKFKALLEEVTEALTEHGLFEPALLAGAASEAVADEMLQHASKLH